MNNKKRRELTVNRRDRVPKSLEQWGVGPFFVVFGILISCGVLLCQISLWFGFFLGPVLIGFFLGVSDALQSEHAILRNFPLLGRLRYVLESIRPELRQYFVESDQEETPFSREKRSLVYQRAKGVRDTIAFGTRRDVGSAGYEWIAQSLSPCHPDPSTARVMIGEGLARPYSASLFNISAMSYGSLSKNAILALNTGAKEGDFYHNSGEGGLSPYHVEPGGDLVWQVGTGYFGCRTKEGLFDPERFVEGATREQVRMIEIKLSQGAKPAHGGILPGKKVSLEVALTRGVEVGQTVVSPPSHSAFSGPRGLLEFVQRLRDLSGGKPVGFKLCVGQPVELFSILKAMHQTEIYPDFITIDGSEGGTGAAPVEFADSVGMPLADGLNLVHNALVGINVRTRLRLISAGKIATGFELLKHLALGADLCNSARGMMFALGCIQALKCNTNECPVGVATQRPSLVRGLDVPDKADRVASFHRRTIASVLDLCGAAGIDSPGLLRPAHLFRRISPSEVRSLARIYPQLEPGALLSGSGPEEFQTAWYAARTDRFGA